MTLPSSRSESVITKAIARRFKRRPTYLEHQDPFFLRKAGPFGPSFSTAQGAASRRRIGLFPKVSLHRSRVYELRSAIFIGVAALSVGDHTLKSPARQEEGQP